jgi:predicted MPP superfamily phosphohydrolase
MFVHLVFGFFVILALMGDARIFLYVMNRVVFGNHREEESPWTFLQWVTPPILLGLTALFWPLNRIVDQLLSTHFMERITPERFEEIAWSVALAKIGATWMIIAASVGMYWIVDRMRQLAIDKVPLAGVRDGDPTLVQLRTPHVTLPWLRKLGWHNDVYDIEVTRHEIFIDDLPEEFDGYRIAFLTDTHVASFVRRAFYKAICDQTRTFDPDLVLLGGDFVTWNRHIALMAEVLGPAFVARDGAYAVLGNHDYWAGGAEVQQTLEARGVKFIVNRSAVLRRGNATLNLIGVDELYRGTPDVAAAFAGIDETRPCLGLSHHPDVIDLVEDRRLDLLVCGHTHGGQIRFPFFGAIVVPSQHEDLYAAGFRRLRNVLIYVSRGIGSIPPLRILCRPEVATFVLRRGARAS